MLPLTYSNQLGGHFLATAVGNVDLGRCSKVSAIAGPVSEASSCRLAMTNLAKVASLQLGFEPQVFHNHV